MDPKVMANPAAKNQRHGIKDLAHDRVVVDMDPVDRVLATNSERKMSLHLNPRLILCRVEHC